MSSPGPTPGATGCGNVLPDWPEGPLSQYRKTASFDWRAMKKLLWGEKVLKYVADKVAILERDPLFAREPWHEPKDRQAGLRQTALQLKRFSELRLLDEDSFFKEPEAAYALYHAMGMFDWSLYIKKAMAQDFFSYTARLNGSKEVQKFVSQVYDLKMTGALLITEMGHGSDTKSLMTTATYEPSTKQFVLHTPCLEATKVWAGNLGQLATHGVVFAQLYTSDGVCHGLHQFLVPLRDSDLRPYPGLKVGDMGPKAGLHGLDNGFLQFDKYRVPLEALLNRGAKIDDNGQYVSKKKSGGRSGAALGALSLGRIGVIVQSYLNLQLAMTIAVRYSAVRKQFGPTDLDKEGVTEWPVIEYQTQQWRLFPYVAAWYVMRVFHVTLHEQFFNFFALAAFGEQTTELAEMGSEMHAISCAGKAVCSWLARDGIQEGREACGGHGYLKAARFGDLRNDHDPNNTYEGDNNVLLQQTANYLIKVYEDKIKTGKQIVTQLKICDFVDNFEAILTDTEFRPSINDTRTLIGVYQFIICYLIKASYEKLNSLKENNDPFVARSQSQVYYQRSLSIVFFECDAITRFAQFADECSDEKLKNVLKKLELLFALWSLEKHFLFLHQAKFKGFNSNFTLSRLKEKILSLCNQLKRDAVALVDVFAPPDFILNSCLGHSDGDVYKHLFEAIQKSGGTQKPDWFTPDHFNSKL